MSTPKADRALLTTFFQQLGGPFHIAARPNRATLRRGVGWTPATVATASEAAALAGDVNDSGACTYFAFNHPTRPWAVAGRKQENVSVCIGALVDIDDTRPAVLHALKHRLQFRPSYVAFTGGGFQAWWRFSEPISNIQDARQIGMGLNLAFEDLGPDSTFSVDHLARAVGTRNHKPGRNSELVRLVYEAWDVVLPVGLAPRGRTTSSNPLPPISIPDWDPPAGSDPNTYLPRRAAFLLEQRPLRFSSRSEHEWAFIGICVRAQVPPEVILHYLARYVVADDEHRIGHRSHWVRIGNSLQPRRDPLRHAEAQIQRMLERGRSE